MPRQPICVATSLVDDPFGVAALDFDLVRVLAQLVNALIPGHIYILLSIQQWRIRRHRACLTRLRTRVLYA